MKRQINSGIDDNKLHYNKLADKFNLNNNKNELNT